MQYVTTFHLFWNHFRILFIFQEAEKKRIEEAEKLQWEKEANSKSLELRKELEEREEKRRKEQERKDEEERLQFVQLEEDLEKQVEESRKRVKVAKIQEELKRLKAEEEAWKKKVAEEEKKRLERQKKKEEMKKQIAEEIERIKKLEEEQKAKQMEKDKLVTAAQQETKPKEETTSSPVDPQISFQSKCLLEKLRLDKEKEEMRIKSEEARKAAERREQARLVWVRKKTNIFF